MTLSPDDRYLRNIAALRARQPEVADVVDVAVIPDGIVPAAGRDGTPTLLIPMDNSGPIWFGRSSMPRAAAEELFCNVRANGGSVTLPGILTGVEAVVIAGRLASQYAVFVVEESPLNLKLAMRLYDYAGLFRDGRLVFILADDIDARLRSFFAAHPGYELPGNMFRVPQKTPGQIAELQRRIERAGGEAIRIQTEMVAAQLDRLRKRVFRSLSTVPSVAVLSVDCRAAALASAERAARALESLGWSRVICVPDRPDRHHVAARLAAIERGAAEFVVYVQGVSTAERAMLPDELPVVAWYRPDYAPPNACAVQPGPFDLFLAGSQQRFEELIEAGFPRNQVERCEPAADVDPDRLHSAAESRVHPRPSGSAAEADRVAVMMDLPDDRPESCGITLPSQIALWRAVRDRVLIDADRYDDDTAETLLQQAEHDSGTTLSDPGIRGTFLSMLRTRLVPATLARSLAQTLVKKGVGIWLWGVNWPTMGRGEDVRCGPIPSGAALNEVMQKAGLVVLPWFCPSAVQSAVDALAGGAVVAMRGSEAEFAREYPDLAVVARFIRFFGKSAELVEFSRGVIADRGRFSEASRTAQRRVLAEHTVAARLKRIAGLIRDRQRVGAPQSSAQVGIGETTGIKTTEQPACGRS